MSRSMYPDRWHLKFNSSLAHKICEAYGLQNITFAPDGEAPVYIYYTHAKGLKRMLSLCEESCVITDLEPGRPGIQMGREGASDWVRALTACLSQAYPPVLQ